MKRILVAITLAVAVQTVSAQDWAKARLEKSSRHGEWVEYKSGERPIKAFVVYPERKDKAPVVLVIDVLAGDDTLPGKHRAQKFHRMAL